MRRLSLPEEVPGRLFLSAMPGRHRSIDDDLERWREAGINLVVSLTPMEEIASRSPDFHAMLVSEGIDTRHVMFPILDFDVPGDPEKFLHFVRRLADRLREGDSVLVHCAGGIGRTGMAAVSILVCLGLDLDEARDRVHAAGSNAETSEQRRFVEWVGSQRSR